MSVLEHDIEYELRVIGLQFFVRNYAVLKECSTWGEAETVELLTTLEFCSSKVEAARKVEAAKTIFSKGAQGFALAKAVLSTRMPLETTVEAMNLLSEETKYE